MYKTYDQIVSEIQQDMISQGSQATDFSDGSQIQTAIAVFSRALRAQWYMLEQLVDLFFVMTTDGPFLDLRVAERGVTRKPGVASSGPISFTRTTPSPISTPIQTGMQFSTLDGSVSVVVTSDVTLPVNWTSGTASVDCTVVGAIGKLPAGTQLQVSGPSAVGLQTIQVGTGGLTGGVDAESDDDLRTRYLETVQNPTDGGTQADYSVWAKEVVGITNASVFPLARGNGTVDVVVADGGIPSAELVSQVQTILDSNRPIGADAQAKAPTSHSIDSTITVWLADGYSLAGVQPSVQQAYNNYVSSIAIGGTYRVMAAADAVFKVPGIIDCTISGTNITLGQEELAVPGTIAVVQGT